MPVIIVARSPEGVVLGPFEGKPIHLIFLLLGNGREYRLDLKVLARLALLITRDGLDLGSRDNL